jgi:hypothetical protein
MATKVSKRTFTYFIPAPPARKSGYREREFDKIMRGIFDSGFELHDLQTQAVPTGLFIIATLKTSSKKTLALDETFDIQEQFRLSHSHSSPDIVLDEDDAL